MSNQRAQGRKMAILAADGFEEIELTSPKEAIEAAGGETMIVSTEKGFIHANQHREHGDKYQVDLSLDEAKAEDFDALLIPGGLFSPDALRTNDKAKSFVSEETGLFNLPRPTGSYLGQSREWPRSHRLPGDPAGPEECRRHCEGPVRRRRRRPRDLPLPG